MRKFIVLSILLVSSTAIAARIWTRQERVELSVARATSFNTVITGQLPTCTNWRRGYFEKQCVNGAANQPLSQAGTCSGGFTVTTVLFPACRYTPTTLGDYTAVPDGAQLETE